MSFDSRIGWMLLGGLIGFIVGYIFSSLREIKDKVEEVDRHVTHDEATEDRGATKLATLNHIALLVVLLITVWAAISTQKTNHSVQDNQNSINNATDCTKDYLSKTIQALNARTEFAKEQAVANIELQKAQSDYLSIFVLHKPPTTQEAFTAALRKYFDALTTFLSASEKTTTAIAENPYPTNRDFSDCLKGK